VAQNHPEKFIELLNKLKNNSPLHELVLKAKHGNGTQAYSLVKSLILKQKNRQNSNATNGAGFFQNLQDFDKPTAAKSECVSCCVIQ
jgi:hypothetical protein